jgi:hypothetical protein
MSTELCGADTPVRELLKARTNTKKIRAIAAEIIRVFAVLWAILREIFDESAYRRFLVRQKLTSSPASYGEFLRENEISKERRPRCC